MTTGSHSIEFNMHPILLKCRHEILGMGNGHQSVGRTMEQEVRRRVAVNLAQG